MDLITNEIQCLKNYCQSLEAKNGKLEHEINLLNILVICSEKCLKHSYELLDYYDKNLNSNNKYLLRNEIKTNRSRAQSNQSELNKLKAKLIEWRKYNNKEPLSVDHTYSSVSVQRGQSQALKPKSIDLSKSTLGPVQTRYKNQEIITPNDEISESLNTETTDSLPIQLEIIPKTEPLSESETDSASETEENSTRPETTDKQTVNNISNNNPFLLGSEYLTKTAFNFINNNNIEPNEEVVNNYKSIAIDLDDSDSQSVKDIPIFDDQEVVSKVKAKKYNRQSKSPLNTLSNAIKNCKLVANNKPIDKTIKINLKGKFYCCKWKKCSYKTSTKANAFKHYRSHIGDKSYKCKLCTKRFTNSRNLSSHLIEHNAAKVVGLETKPISVTKKIKPKNVESKQINSQKERHVTGGGDIICPVFKCEHRYYEFSKLMRHLIAIHGQKRADNYKKQYYKKKSLIRAEKSDNTISPKKLALIEDNKKIPEKSQKTLTGRRSDQNQKQWKCDYINCERRYFDKHNLKRHQIEIHKKLSALLFNSLRLNKTSNFGIKFFKPPKSSDQSKVEHNSYVCNHKGCDGSYRTLSGLYKHRKTKHSKNNVWAAVKKTMSSSPKKTDTSTDNKPSLSREWVCDVPNCGSRYIYKQNLKRHMKEHHTIPDDQQSNASNSSVSSPKVKFECTYKSCGFYTFYKKTLVMHYKTHYESDVNPFKCLITDCHYSINSLHKLKNHVLNKHSEQEFLRAMESTGIRYPVW